MPLSPKDCCILNGGNGSWAFGPLASRLSSYLGVDISEEPRHFNYLLHIEQNRRDIAFDSFIPIESIHLASDKRLLAKLFLEKAVQTPQTILCDTFCEVMTVVHDNFSLEWCIKYPTSCGANGHRLLTKTSDEPRNWPRPFVVQEFIRLDRPEVYRIYYASGQLFGWVARRFPEGSTKTSSWVAHAQGARYVILNDPPSESLVVAKTALDAAGLLNSFGCVDLLRRPTGEWLVLEVGTDGLFNHVDRDLGDPDLEHEIDKRITRAFWKAAGNYRLS
jgi:hypothetical protein